MSVARPYDQDLWMDRSMGPIPDKNVTPAVPKKPFVVKRSIGIARIPLSEQLGVFSPERGS